MDLPNLTKEKKDIRDKITNEVLAEHGYKIKDYLDSGKVRAEVETEIRARYHEAIKVFEQKDAEDTPLPTPWQKLAGLTGKNRELRNKIMDKVVEEKGLKLADLKNDAKLQAEIVNRYNAELKADLKDVAKKEGFVDLTKLTEEDIIREKIIEEVLKEGGHTIEDVLENKRLTSMVMEEVAKRLEKQIAEGKADLEKEKGKVEAEVFKEKELGKAEKEVLKEKWKAEKAKRDKKAVVSITGFKGEAQLEKIILFLQRNIARLVLVSGITLAVLRIIFPVYINKHYAVKEGYLSQEEVYRLGLEVPVKDIAMTLLQFFGIAVITAIILVLLNKKLRAIIISFVETITSFIKRNAPDVVLTFGSILIALRLFINHGRYATALLQAIGIAVITGIIFYLLKNKQKK